MKLIIRFFIKSNIWVAFCVLGLAFSTEILLNVINYKISLFVFISTIFVYNYQRIFKLKKDHKHPYKSFIENNKNVIYILMFLTLMVNIYLFFSFKLSTQIMIFLIGALSFFYPFGLRKIPFAKIFIISFVWAVSTMLLIVLENNIPISESVILKLASLFLFVFSITIPFDIRDVDVDLKNVITIPLFFGVKRAKMIAFITLFICGLISFFQYRHMYLSFSSLLALVLLYIFSFIFIQKSDKSNKKMYYSFWGESLSLLSYFLLLITEAIF